MKTRMWVFWALILCLLLSACSGTTAASGVAIEEKMTTGSATQATEKTEKAPLKVGLLGKSVKPVGVLVAQANGYFEEEGVQVEFETVSSMNDAYLAVSNGDLDVYLFSSTAAATFISQGVTSLRVFGGTAAEGSEIMAAAGTPAIKGVEDLVGKVIACQMPETGQMVLKNYLLERGYTIGAPGEGADVSFVYVNDSNLAVEGCVKGEYDYCITNSVLGYYADRFGAAVVGSVKQFVENYPCCRQTCSQQAYEEKWDSLVAFETAVLRGHRFYLENREETLDILVDYSGQDRDYMEAQVYGTESYVPVMRLSLDPDKKACVNFYQAMANLDMIDNSVQVDWEQYVVTDIYEKALNNLLSKEESVQIWRDMHQYFLQNN